MAAFLTPLTKTETVTGMLDPSITGTTKPMPGTTYLQTFVYSHWSIFTPKLHLLACRWREVCSVTSDENISKQRIVAFLAENSSQKFTLPHSLTFPQDIGRTGPEPTTSRGIGFPFRLMGSLITHGLGATFPEAYGRRKRGENQRREACGIFRNQGGEK